MPPQYQKKQGKSGRARSGRYIAECTRKAPLRCETQAGRYVVARACSLWWCRPVAAPDPRTVITACLQRPSAAAFSCVRSPPPRRSANIIISAAVKPVSKPAPPDWLSRSQVGDPANTVADITTVAHAPTCVRRSAEMTPALRPPAAERRFGSPAASSGRIVEALHQTLCPSTSTQAISAASSRNFGLCIETVAGATSASSEVLTSLHFYRTFVHHRSHDSGRWWLSCGRCP